MQRQRVNSSRVHSIGYDEKQQLLEIEFSDGHVYQYKGVSPEVHRRFMAGPNPASFYEDRIAEDYSGNRV